MRQTIYFPKSDDRIELVPPVQSAAPTGSAAQSRKAIIMATSIAQALAVLSAAGIDVSEMTSDLLSAQAQEVFVRKCVSADNSEVWTEKMFALAAEVADEIVSDVKTIQGGATRRVHLFGIDTEFGHLSVSLKSEV